MYSHILKFFFILRSLNVRKVEKKVLKGGEKRIKGGGGEKKRRFSLFSPTFKAAYSVTMNIFRKKIFSF